MTEFNFDAKLSAAELYAFSMRHTYKSMSGIFGLIISFGSLIICAVRYKYLDKTAIMALIIIGLIFTVIQPLMLWSKANAQVKKNKSINAKLHYNISDNGITVSQGNTANGSSVGFASDQQIKDGNSWAVAEKVFEINAGVPLYRVTGDPALVGYSPLMPAQQLMTTDANGGVVSDPVTVNIAVAALGDVQNVEIYYYSETDHKWELAPVNGIDHATNSVNVTIPGNAVFTLVHKN